MDHIILTYDPISLKTVCDLVRDDACGAISTFEGVTRSTFDDKEVVSLSYEAHFVMAHQELKRILRELRKKHDIQHIAVAHRVGKVGVGETSVVISASSIHRVAAMQCVSDCINRLKESVSIWKKECYSDGDGVWKENVEWKEKHREVRKLQNGR